MNVDHDVCEEIMSSDSGYEDNNEAYSEHHKITKICDLSRACEDIS